MPLQRLRRHRRHRLLQRPDYLAQSLQRSGQIQLLVARHIVTQHEEAVLGDLAAVHGVQARLRLRRYEVHVVHTEPQIDFRVDAIDVLAARAAAAAVRDAQLLDGNESGEFAVHRCGLKEESGG